MDDMTGSPGQIFTTALAWSAILVILVILAVLHRRRPFTKGEQRAFAYGSLAIGIAGALTATLGVFPSGTFDVELVRYVLIGLRAIGTAIYLGVMFSMLEWHPFGRLF